MLNLRVAFEAEIGVTFHKHLAVHGSVWGMTNRAAFTQSFMFENKRPGLFPMTLRAILIEPGHRQPPRRFENIGAMRIVAVHAIHAIFKHRMMLRKIELGMGLQVAVEARRGVFSRIDDKFSPSAPGRNMFAARAVTGFTAGFIGQLGILEIYAAMCTRGKAACDVSMAKITSGISDVSRAGDFHWHERGFG